MNSKNNLEMNNKIEIRNEGKKAYDIVLNGNEIGGGSVRIHQNDIQERMFEALGFTKESAYEQFGFLMNTFKYGVPPHAGLAYGLDCFVLFKPVFNFSKNPIFFLLFFY